MRVAYGESGNEPQYGQKFTSLRATQKVGGLPEDASGGCGFKIVSAEVFVEALQASAFGEMLALRLADARQDVEVCGKPAIVFRKETGNEFARVVGAGSHQISPGDLGPGSSGNDDAGGANADLAAVEIKSGGVGEKSSKPGRAHQGKPGFGIVLCQSPIEAGHGGIVGKQIDHVVIVFLLSSAQRDPVRFFEQDWDSRGSVGIDERYAFLQGFFEFGEGEA